MLKLSETLVPSTVRLIHTKMASNFLLEICQDQIANLNVNVFLYRSTIQRLWYSPAASDWLSEILAEISLL